MNDLALRWFKIIAKIRSSSEFCQQGKGLQWDQNISIMLFEPVQIALTEKKYLITELRDTCDDFFMDSAKGQVTNLKIEQHKGKFELIAGIEFSDELNFLSEAIMSVLSSHRAVKEHQVNNILPILKVAASEQQEVVERASRHFNLPSDIFLDRILLWEKVSVSQWSESSEIARFLS